MNSILHRLKQEDGQALLEFAFVFPIILVFLLMLVDFGIALDRREVIQHAVREGARRGAVGDTPLEIVNETIDQSQGAFDAADVDVCYVDGPGGDPAFGSEGSYVRVTGEYTYEFAIGRDLLNYFGVGTPGIDMDPSAEARLESDVAGATEC